MQAGSTHAHSHNAARHSHRRTARPCTRGRHGDGVRRGTQPAAGSTRPSSGSWAATSTGTCTSASPRSLPTFRRPWSSWEPESVRTCATCRSTRAWSRSNPTPTCTRGSRRAARSHGVDLEIRSVVGERIDLPDASADAVISSLVLCSVRDPDAVLAEIRRVLRPGGRFSFAEHVAARPRTPTRWTQRILRRPWAWVFEGCSCERDLATVIRSAGFASVDLCHYRIHSPFLPFNKQYAN